MSEFKKGQKVEAKAMRSLFATVGQVAAVEQTPRGDWITIQPDDQTKNAFKTRPALVKAMAGSVSPFAAS